MLTQPEVQEIVQMLLDAEESVRQVRQIVESFPEMSIEDAYAVQLALVERKLSSGRVLVGKKVALTNPAVQRVLGVHGPLFGHLMDDMFVQEGVPISCSRLIQPKIEPEIAFLMKKDLAGPGVTAARVLGATAGVMPALEIPDARPDWFYRASFDRLGSVSAVFIE